MELVVGNGNVIFTNIIPFYILTVTWASHQEGMTKSIQSPKSTFPPRVHSTMGLHTWSHHGIQSTWHMLGQRSWNKMWTLPGTPSNQATLAGHCSQKLMSQNHHLCLSFFYSLFLCLCLCLCLSYVSLCLWLSCSSYHPSCCVLNFWNPWALVKEWHENIHPHTTWFGWLAPTNQWMKENAWLCQKLPGIELEKGPLGFTLHSHLKWLKCR